MQIVLFRHGPAGRRDASRWPDDTDRPLTARGESRTLAASAGLTRILDREITRILTSPLARATRTAQLLVEAGRASRLQTLECLSPGGSARDVLSALRGFKSDDTVVLVGHEPDLGLLAGLLAFGSARPLPLKKAGACVLACEADPAPGSAQLLALLPPSVLRALGRKKGAAA